MVRDKVIEQGRRRDRLTRRGWWLEISRVGETTISRMGQIIVDLVCEKDDVAA